MAALAELLIVDDEAAQMTALCDTLESAGYVTTGFTSAKQALATLRHRTFDLVLTDLMMPEMDGVTLLRAAMEIDPNLVGIVMTGHGTIDSAIDALKTGALDYILKPFRLSAILPLLTRACAMQQLRRENIQLREAAGIHELGTAIAFTTDFDTILHKVADAAFQQSDAKEVALLLPTNKRELRVAVVRGGDGKRSIGAIEPIGEELSKWIAGPSDSRPAAALGAPDSPASVSIPMVAGGTLIGVLHFASMHAHRPIPPGQIKALTILAGSAASALAASSLVERLRTAEQRYRRLAEAAPDVVFRYEVHPRHAVSFVNPAITKLTGYLPDEFYSDPELLSRMTHPDDRPVMDEILRGVYPTGALISTRWVAKVGKTVWVEQRIVAVRDAEGSLVAIEGIARDLTERRGLEEQLRHSQKMEAIGRLTAGVAHDFNNLLTVINGYSDLALKELPPHTASHRKIDEVRKAGEQAAAMTSQLLASGRKQASQPKVLNLNSVIAGSTSMLRRLIGEDVELSTDLDVELDAVKFDEGQLQQILLNLAVNARDAMPRGGKLIIQTRNVSRESCPALGAHAGPLAMIAIRDTGCGMDADTQSLIFEPFFTTKELGKGTGLGLSIVYGIVTQSGGHISVESEPGLGTTFRIHLRRMSDQTDPQSPVPTPVKAQQPGAATILLVEDDPRVRGLVQEVLTFAGYHVIATEDGVEALSASDTYGGEIQLLVTDVLLPKIRGVEVAQELTKRRQGLKVLFMSGYTGDSVLPNMALNPDADFLQKPFTPESLCEKVRMVMLGAPVL